MKLAAFVRLQGLGSLAGPPLVTDTLFAFCYWPKLDRPTRIFAPGSSGIRVMGTTPRNVWFPDDVVFESYYPDALYPAEQAVKAAFPFKRIGMVNLSPAEAAVWMEAYERAIASFPPTHTVLETPRGVNFLRHREEVSRRTVTLASDSVDAQGQILHAGARITKIDYDEFVAELTPQESADLVDGKLDEAALRAAKTFVHISRTNPDKSPVTLEQARAERAGG